MVRAKKQILWALCASYVLSVFLGGLAYGQQTQSNAGEKIGTAKSQTSTIADAASKFKDETSGLRPEVRISFRLRAAGYLLRSQPTIARRLVDLSLDEIRKSDKVMLDDGAMRSLVAVAPADSLAILPHLVPGSDHPLLDALIASRHADVALALYRALLSRNDLEITAAIELAKQLAVDQPADAKALAREIIGKFDVTSAEPDDVLRLLNFSDAIKPFAPDLALQICRQVVKAASAADYGKHAQIAVTARASVGNVTLNTTDSRETLLLLAGVRVYSLAPDHLRELEPILTRWDVTKPVKVLSTRFTIIGEQGAQSTPARRWEPAEAAIWKAMYDIRSKTSMADKSRGVVEASRMVRDLSDGEGKLRVARQLCEMVMVNGFEEEARTAAAGALAEALNQYTGPPDAYLELATLVRREQREGHLKPVGILAVAVTLLDLRDLCERQTNITLTGLDGKQLSLASLKGKVVLLNLWATWCMPCRVEMPDIEALYRELSKQGLVVLAVTDEDRDIVSDFALDHSYTFPMLLDPDHKVRALFETGQSVTAVPTTFIIDRDGSVVASAVGSRSRQQFREMLAKAGIR